MHRLTCKEADRLAHDLREAEHLCRAAASEHADRHTAYRVLGMTPLAMYHESAHRQALDTADKLRDYARRLTERIPLWDTAKGPESIRTPKVRAKPAARERIKRGRAA